MQIQIDSREKAKAIKKIIAEFNKQEVKYHVSKLYVGDYMNFDNPRLIIDRKQNLSELYSNLCQGHERFINELKRANKAEIKLIILCEHGGKIKCLEDTKHWINPRILKNPYAWNGERLYKTMRTVAEKYNTDFLFCNKEDTGKKIIDLLL